LVFTDTKANAEKTKRTISSTAQLWKNIAETYWTTKNILTNLSRNNFPKINGNIW
jgi:hypothetical protein